jgi:hypothetical protein
MGGASLANENGYPDESSTESYSWSSPERNRDRRPRAGGAQRIISHTALSAQ